MKTVHKAALEAEDVQVITVPKDAKFLYVNVQRERICVWYECETSKPTEKRKLVIYGTGHEMFNTEHTYIGSVIMHEGSLLVFHVYEIGF